MSHKVVCVSECLLFLYQVDVTSLPFALGMVNPLRTVKATGSSSFRHDFPANNARKLMEAFKAAGTLVLVIFKKSGTFGFGIFRGYVK